MFKKGQEQPVISPRSRSAWEHREMMLLAGTAAVQTPSTTLLGICFRLFLGGRGVGAAAGLEWGTREGDGGWRGTGRSMEAMGCHRRRAAAPTSRHLEAHPEGSKFQGSYHNTPHRGVTPPAPLWCPWAVGTCQQCQPGCDPMPNAPADPGGEGGWEMGHPHSADVWAVSRGTWQPFSRLPSP